MEVFILYKKKDNFKYWNSVWSGDDYSRDELRRLKASTKIECLLKHVSVDSFWNVVDFGSGPGYVSEELYRRAKCNITCIDSSEKAVALAKERLKNFPFTFIFSDVCSSGLDTHGFDLAMCCGIIEHVIDRELFLDEIQRVLKPGGILYVVSSNRYSMIWPQRILKQILGLWPFGYQVNIPFKQLSKLMSRHGFKIVEHEVINDIGDYRILGKIDRWLSKIFPGFGRYVVMVCEKELR